MSPSTVRMWATRGALTRRGRDWRGRALYDVDEALRHAEAAGHAPTCKTP